MANPVTRDVASKTSIVNIRGVPSKAFTHEFRASPHNPNEHVPLLSYKTSNHSMIQVTKAMPAMSHH